MAPVAFLKYDTAAGLHLNIITELGCFYINIYMYE